MILACGIIDGFEIEAIFTSVEAARLAGYEVIEEPTEKQDRERDWFAGDARNGDDAIDEG